MQSHQRITVSFIYLFAVLIGGFLGAAERIAILPAEIALRGPAARHGLLVQALRGDQLASQIRDGVTWESSDPNVAIVDNGQVVAQGNGSAVLTARLGDVSATAHVEVSGTEQAESGSFRHDVQAVLTKRGCNSGACHGALAGKGGLKLSLRGYDTLRDWETLTRQARGRRVELSDPGRSLLLTKPSGGLPHKGGLRMETDSLDYRIVAAWIAAGAPAPADDDPALDRIEVLPAQTLVKPGDEQQILVRAYYADGRVRDVTPWAKFTSTDETVASIDEQGRVRVTGHGEGAVTAWFDSKIVIARITSPYANQVDPQVFAQAPRQNFVDGLVLQQLQRLNLPPSPPATDSEWIRRVYLDTLGVLPTPDEVTAFLADTASDKRQQWIEKLLERPEFVDYWTYKWSDILLLSGQNLRPDAVKSYYQWIHQRVKQNQPWDAFVREIVTAQGHTMENGATNFYSLHQSPEEMSENVSQAFLGLSIGCAKCHNHPLEKWTNDQYYAMANLFSRVRAKGWGGDSRSGDGKRTVFVVDKGELLQPLTGRPQPPAPLDGQPLDMHASADRRLALAAWLTAPENPYFTRAIVNRVWANFFAVGLVEPIDDLRSSNPASNEPLLAALAQHLVEHRYDLKQLIRVILQSATYARSSQPLTENRAETRFYSRYYPRRLMAEVLLDAISQVTAVPTPFNQIEYPGADRQKTDFYPLGTRAIQLYDSAVASYFLQTFGRNERQITCECERTDEPSMVQVLHMSNGDTINQKLRAPEGRVAKLLASDTPNYAIIEQAYLHALSRRPTDAEMQSLLAILNDSPTPDDRKLAVEDLFWSLLTSREFVFGH